MTTLTAGGRAAPPPTRTDKDPYVEWKRVVTTMLALAVKTKPVRDRLEVMRVWIEENPFHDQINERMEQHHCELMDSYAVEGKLYDLAAEACYWQMQMTEGQIAMIEGWLGVHLTPMVSQKWAKVAQWVGTSEIKQIVAVGEVVECPF